MPLQSRFRAFWRYRPRVLTVALLFVLAAVVAMANLTSEIQRLPGRGGLGVIYLRGVYGWPFMWHWHNIAGTMATDVIVGWEYSRAKLAANVACWIFLLAVPGAVCEWLLRRYRHPVGQTRAWKKTPKWNAQNRRLNASIGSGRENRALPLFRSDKTSLAHST
ncbi:MAG: hypothetical protein ACREHD_16720 [Pirellulales bacterium]